MVGYQVPDFSGGGSRGSGGNMIPAMPGGGQNQYMNFPSMGTDSFGGFPRPEGGPVYPLPMGTNTAANQPGIVPQATPIQTGQTPGLSLPTTASKSGGFGLQGGAATGPSIDPALTNMLGMLYQGQLGKGVAPFDLSALLPSTGQATTPGQLTAPLTPMLGGLEQFFAGQGGGPTPYILPMWQSELAAMNQPIQQQLANIKEQFGSQGALGSSEMAQAMANYGQQTALQEQSLLGQLTMQALPQQMAFGQGLQGLDQQAIQAMQQEFMRTQPQNNPLLQYAQQLGTTFPPIYTKQGGMGSALLGQAGSLLGMGTGIASSIGEGLAGGGGVVDVLSSLAGLFGI